MVGAPGIAAGELFRQLEDRGFHAVITNTVTDGGIRVFVGPYPDTASLQLAKTALQAAGFQALRAIRRGEAVDVLN